MIINCSIFCIFMMAVGTTTLIMNTTFYPSCGDFNYMVIGSYCIEGSPIETELIKSAVLNIIFTWFILCLLFVVIILAIRDIRWNSKDSVDDDIECGKYIEHDTLTEVIVSNYKIKQECVETEIRFILSYISNKMTDGCERIYFPGSFFPLSDDILFCGMILRIEKDLNVVFDFTDTTYPGCVAITKNLSICDIKQLDCKTTE